jgi:hypothetical protein
LLCRAIQGKEAARVAKLTPIDIASAPLDVGGHRLLTDPVFAPGDPRARNAARSRPHRVAEP